MYPTNRRIAILFASLICMTTTACTTIKPVYEGPQASFASQLKPGDRVRITLINDRTKEINITEVDEAGIKGVIHKASTTSENLTHQDRGSGCRHSRGDSIPGSWRDVYGRGLLDRPRQRLVIGRPFPCGG